MAFVFLLLSSVCSLTIAHLLKLTEVKGLRTLNTLTVNYLVAFVFAFGVGIWEGSGTHIASQSGYLILFCIIVGAFFIGNFVVYGKSVHTNGVGITIAAMRLSLLVPVLISVFLYTEYLSMLKITGIVLVLGALVLLIPKKSSVKIGNVDASWLLVIIFLLSGFADASLKIYNEDFSSNLNESIFMGMVFVGAFIIGLVFCLFRKGPLVTKKEALLGASIGIPNLYSSIFLIYALEGISGAVAFPVVNTINVLGGTFLGLAVWSDNVSTKQWVGIGVAILAIIILL
jgi:drug/metabolite transporter (DMT)-like permease